MALGTKSLPFVFAFVLATAARAEIVEDQDGSVPEAVAALALGDTQTLGQTFEIATSGTFAAIELQLSRGDAADGTYEVAVVRVVGEKPSLDPNDVLFRQSMPARDLPRLYDYGGYQWPFTSIDLSAAAIQVEPGQKLAVVVTRDVPVDTQTWIVWTSGAGYDWGRGLYRNEISSVPERRIWAKFPVQSFGFAFKTYVDR